MPPIWVSDEVKRLLNEAKETDYESYSHLIERLFKKLPKKNMTARYPEKLLNKLEGL